MNESRVLTGIRPTGDLSVANYVGAMQPILDIQESHEGPINVFVADIHGLTDQEPELVDRTRLDTVRSFMAAGMDPERVTIYLQTQIEFETVALASLLDRHISIAELLRVPTLKDKMKAGQKEENVTVALARYPILMAADIFIQDATDVPVGKDQHPHIEVARTLARRFNAEYGTPDEDVIVVPRIMSVEGLRIAALDGNGKMSKSNPKGAIFLKDTDDSVRQKISKAKTDHAGEINETLESHFLLTEQLAANANQKAELDSIRNRHMAGENVMKDFKVFMGDVVVEFLESFRQRYGSISDQNVVSVLEQGGQVAQEYADGMLGRVKKSMGFIQ